MGVNAEALSTETILSVRDSILINTSVPDTKRNSPASTEKAAFKFYTLSKKQYPGKRMMDFVLGFAGFLLFAICFPVIAIGIKLSSRGPVIFKQKRTGQNGKTFTCYKFRTMHQLDLRRIDNKPVVTQKGDRRIFHFGSFLRRANLDELPQIINVVKGDMSLVGPRPYPIEECAHWNSTFDDFFYRYAVKPGVSGWAQINGLRGGTLNEEHMRARLDKDLVYVQKQNLGFDLKIIFRTLWQMIHRDTNAY